MIKSNKKNFFLLSSNRKKSILPTDRKFYFKKNILDKINYVIKHKEESKIAKDQLQSLNKTFNSYKTSEKKKLEFSMFKISKPKRHYSQYSKKSDNKTDPSILQKTPKTHNNRFNFQIKNKGFFRTVRVYKKGKDVATDLKEKLKFRKVNKNIFNQKKVKEYVEKQKYLEAKPENRLKNIQANKLNHEQRMIDVRLKKTNNFKKKMQLNYFINRKREIKDCLKEMDKKKEKRNQQALLYTTKWSTIITLCKFIKAVYARFKDIKIANLKNTQKQKNILTCILKFEKIALKVKKYRPERARNVFLTFINIKESIGRNTDEYKKPIAILLMNKYQSYKISLKCAKLRNVFKFITYNVKRSLHYRRFIKKFLLKNLNDFIQNLKNKIQDYDFISNYVQIMIKGITVMDLNTKCYHKYVNYNVKSVRIADPKNLDEQFFNYMVSVFTKYMPYKNGKDKHFTVSRFLKSPKLNEILSLFESTLLNTYIIKNNEMNR